MREDPSIMETQHPAAALTAPRAQQRPVSDERHGECRVDEYAWLRDREDPALLPHLEAENRYLAASLAHTQAWQETLYHEMVARIQETDASVPYREGSWYYLHRTEAGKQYAIHCRRSAPDGPETVILDENALAEGCEFLHVGNLEVSPDGRLLAYAVDESGDEQFVIRVKDLTTGELLADAVEGVSESIAWANDNRTFLYVVLDDLHRPFKVMRHRLGEDPAQDAVLHLEPDERFFVSVERSRSGRFLFVDASSHTTTEQRALDADDLDGGLRLLAARRQGVEYEFHDHHDRWIVLTNDQAVNFRVMECAATATDPGDWREVLAHREEVFVTGIDVFADHLVVFERRLGLPAVRIRRLSTGEEHEMEFDEAVFTLGDGDNCVFDTDVLRFEYSSLTTPRSIYDYGMNDRARTLLKRTAVLGGYDPTRYRTERIFAAAPDGAQVPISLVYHHDTPIDGSAPLYLVGYGAYGISILPRFGSDRVSLLDRGVVYAIAHVRGGGYLGRRWYETGKLEHKHNTFADFIACAEALVARGYTCRERLAIWGGSAGGLLVGAVLNQRPDLFRAAVAEVPFVDVLNSMLDESLPLTVIEYEEWGNPNEADAYRRIRAYSPYDNVSCQAYPAILATAGINDPRVGFWEATKWVARLRDRTTSDRPVLLKVHLGAGHQGASGRYDWLKERALVFAFVLDQVGAWRG